MAFACCVLYCLRRKKKQSYFVKNLNKRSENLQNGNVCAHDRGSTKAVERFGFGKRSSSDASRRTKPTDTLRHRASNSENGKPVMYYDAKGEFQVENVPGWCSEESDTENAVDGNDDDNIVENGDSFFPTRQATTAYKARRGISAAYTKENVSRLLMLYVFFSLCCVFPSRFIACRRRDIS